MWAKVTGEVFRPSLSHSARVAAQDRARVDALTQLRVSCTSAARDMSGGAKLRPGNKNRTSPCFVQSCCARVVRGATGVSKAPRLSQTKLETRARCDSLPCRPLGSRLWRRRAGWVLVCWCPAVLLGARHQQRARGSRGFFTIRRLAAVPGYPDRLRRCALGPSLLQGAPGTVAHVLLSLVNVMCCSLVAVSAHTSLWCAARCSL